MLIRFGFVFCLSVIIYGCGGGGSSSTGGSASQSSTQNQISVSTVSAPLSLVIDFPPDGSLSAKSSIAFSGRVDGLTNTTNAQIRVGSESSSVSAVLTENTWTVAGVSLVSGADHYQVELLIDGEVMESQFLQLDFDDGFYPFGIGDALALNESGSTSYLLDGRQIVQVDTVSGDRSFSVDVPAEVSSPTDLLWLSMTDKLIILDANGAAYLLDHVGSNWNSLGQIEELDAQALEVNISGSSLLAYESGSHALQIYDMDFSVVEEFQLSEAIPAVDKLAYLNSDTFLLISENDLVVFNSNTEESTSFSTEGLNLGSIGEIALDRSRSDLYVRSASTNELWRLHLDLDDAAGYSAEIVDLGEITSYAMAYSSVQDVLVVTSPNQLSAYDSELGEVTVLSQLGWGGGARWVAPASLALDAQGSFAYVSDLADDDIYQVDLATGNRTALNTNGESMEAVTGMVQNGQNLYSVDWVKKSVLMTDVDTGLTSDLIVDSVSQPDLSEPIAIDMDAVRFRAFVLDRGLRAIYEVDTATGNALVIANSGEVAALTLAKDLSVDESNQVIYWSSWLDNSLHRLSLNSLESELISGSARGEGVNFGRPGSIALDVAQSVAYVSDSLDGRIFEVDLDSGARRVVLDSHLLSTPESIALDASGGILNILDSGTGGLYALYPESGDLVLISM